MKEDVVVIVALKSSEKAAVCRSIWVWYKGPCAGAVSILIKPVGGVILRCRTLVKVYGGVMSYKVLDFVSLSLTS